MIFMNSKNVYIIPKKRFLPAKIGGFSKKWKQINFREEKCSHLNIVDLIITEEDYES